jgi:hypothetical protein
MMEAVRTSETSVDNHFTRQYIPEDNSEQLRYLLNQMHHYNVHGSALPKPILAQENPVHNSHPLTLLSILILSSQLGYISHVVRFLRVFRLKFCMQFSHLQYMRKEKCYS